MTHKADHTFFDRKQEWSKRKDKILAYYLEPYLTKIAALRKPVLIVDGFAGPGKFLDGEPGSPLIIRAKITEARQKRNAGNISSFFVESNKTLFESLRPLLADFSGATTRHCEFLVVVPELEKRASSHSVFLYLDPYTVEGLEWSAIDSILRHISTTDSSVELLLNFNVDSLCRRGLAALKLAAPAASEDVPEPAVELDSNPTIEKLNAIVGGDWWQDILRKELPYPERVAHVTAKFCEQLRQRCAEVCTHEIKERWRHKVPKYVLVFGSRHPDTRELMNDAMVRSLEMLAESEKSALETLFETRSEQLVPDPNQLERVVLACATRKMARKELIWSILGHAFGRFVSGEIKRKIGSLIKDGRLRCDRMDGRQNDDTLIWRS